MTDTIACSTRNINRHSVNIACHKGAKCIGFGVVSEVFEGVGSSLEVKIWGRD